MSRDSTDMVVNAKTPRRQVEEEEGEINFVLVFSLPFLGVLASWRLGVHLPAVSLGKCSTEETHPVAVEDRVHVRLAVLPRQQDVGELLQVGDRVQVTRRLLVP